MVSSSEVEANTGKQRRSECFHESIEGIIFNPDCIFCNKEGTKAVKECNSCTTELTFSIGKDSWRKVLALAEQPNDEKLPRRIRGFDFFSCEAKYHPSCRPKYVRDPAAWQSKDEETKSEQKYLEKVHNEAFQKVCVRVQQEVLQL